MSKTERNTPIPGELIFNDDLILKSNGKPDEDGDFIMKVYRYDPIDNSLSIISSYYFLSPWGIKECLNYPIPYEPD
jgi:hypothetical protein